MFRNYRYYNTISQYFRLDEGGGIIEEENTIIPLDRHRIYPYGQGTSFLHIHMKGMQIL